jgi:hypothetical protein
MFVVIWVKTSLLILIDLVLPIRERGKEFGVATHCARIQGLGDSETTVGGRLWRGEHWCTTGRCLTRR